MSENPDKKGLEKAIEHLGGDLHDARDYSDQEAFRKRVDAKVKWYTKIVGMPERDADLAAGWEDSATQPEKQKKVDRTEFLTAQEETLLEAIKKLDLENLEQVDIEKLQQYKELLLKEVGYFKSLTDLQRENKMDTLIDVRRKIGLIENILERKTPLKDNIEEMDTFDVVRALEKETETIRGFQDSWDVIESRNPGTITDRAARVEKLASRYADLTEKSSALRMQYAQRMIRLDAIISSTLSFLDKKRKSEVLKVSQTEELKNSKPESNQRIDVIFKEIEPILDRFRKVRKEEIYLKSLENAEKLRGTYSKLNTAYQEMQNLLGDNNNYRRFEMHVLGGLVEEIRSMINEIERNLVSV